MAETTYGLPAAGVGPGADVLSLTNGATQAVLRETVALGDGDPTNGGPIRARILGANPAGAENGLVVRNVPSGIQQVSWFPAVAAIYQASGPQTLSGNGVALSVAQFRSLKWYLGVTAMSGTGNPSLQCTLQSSPDGGTTWYDDLPFPGPQLAAAAATKGSTTLSIGNATSVGDFGVLVRVAWVITGTTPSFTFSISYVGK